MHDSVNKPLNPSKSFRPVVAGGQVLFYDYHKNKFGIIVQIRTETGEVIEKARVDERGLATEKILQDGSSVLFTLCRGKNGYYATKVRTEEELSLQELLDIVQLISFSAIQKQLDRTSDEAINQFPEKLQEQLLTYLFDQPHPAAWRVIHHFKPDRSADYFAKHYGASKFGVPMAYLKKAFDPLVFKLVGSMFNTLMSADVTEYLDIVLKHQVAYEDIPSSYWNCFKRADLKYHEHRLFGGEAKNTGAGFFKRLRDSNRIKRYYPSGQI